jgi:hypothetical protein
VLALFCRQERSRAVDKFTNVFKKKGFVSYNGGLQINSALVIGFLQSRRMSVAIKG